jgi:hypothetical protein
MLRRMSRRFAATTIILAALASQASAFDHRTESVLKRLDPETRLIQACNMEAMRRIDRDPSSFHPDRVMIDQIETPKLSTSVLRGTGGVLRSGGEWYHLSFTCKASADRLTIVSFDYKVGAKIDRDDWDELGLFP